MGIEKLMESKVSEASHRLEVERIVAEIAKRSSPVALYLFGSSLPSHARHEGSDIDLAVIVKAADDLKSCQRAIYASPPVTMGKLDLLFYSRDQFIKNAQMGGVCQIIWEEGELVYGTEMRP